MFQCVNVSCQTVIFISKGLSLSTSIELCLYLLILYRSKKLFYKILHSNSRFDGGYNFIKMWKFNRSNHLKWFKKSSIYFLQNVDRYKNLPYYRCNSWVCKSQSISEEQRTHKRKLLELLQCYGPRKKLPFWILWKEL